MYELIQLTDHDYYIDCPSKIGIVKVSENEVVLIDSGSDKSVGKTILKITDHNNWKIVSILLTHSHADHIGGCKTIQDKTGCSIYAKGIESAFSNYPILEPYTLFGSFPNPDLRCKFLEAQTSSVKMIPDDNILFGIRAISLKGHTCDMTGFITPDGTFYIGDSLASEENLEKHPITFIADISQYLETLKNLKSVSADRFVASHAPVYINIEQIAQYNATTVNYLADKIYKMCCEPISFEALLSKLMREYNIPGSIIQYYLIGSTLKSYLNYLFNLKKIEYAFDDTLMVWKQIYN